MPHATTQSDATITRPRGRKARFKRIRFVSSELSATPDARARVKVVLSEGRKHFEAQADGVGGETVVVRLAVEAAIRALHSITDSAGTLQLVGIKLVQAFDGRVVLVCLHSTLLPDAKLLGAVPVSDTVDEAAARAVLDATNRLTELKGFARGTNGDAGATSDVSKRDADGAAVKADANVSAAGSADENANGTESEANSTGSSANDTDSD